KCLRIIIEAGICMNGAYLYECVRERICFLHNLTYCTKLPVQMVKDIAIGVKRAILEPQAYLRCLITASSGCTVVTCLDAHSAFRERGHKSKPGRVQLDFRFLVPGEGHKGKINGSGRPECRMLSCFIREGQRQLLKHPLCETFLYLKWLKVRFFFLINLIFYSILVSLLTIYILIVYTGSIISAMTCKNEMVKNWSESNKTDVEHDNHCIPKIVDHHNFATQIILQTILWVIFIMVFILGLKELLQILDKPSVYLSSWDNILVGPNIVMCLAIVISGFKKHYHYEHVEAWEHHIAALLILFSWVELLMLIGRFPIFGLYIQMFAQVTKNFGKFLLAYSCLINAFSLSFGVLFPTHKPLNALGIRLIKTIVMMTGEIEYDDWFFGDDHKVKYPVTSHLVFLFFLMFVTIILMNLLVGLAVSDIQGLQKSAGLDRLVLQTELIMNFETIMFSQWLSWLLPEKALKMLMERMLLGSSLYGWTLVRTPKALRDSGITPELVEVILRVARARDYVSRRRNAFANFRSLSNAASYTGDDECDIQRGMEALRCGIDLLVWDVDERNEDMHQMKEAVSSIRSDMELLNGSLKMIVDAISSGNFKENVSEIHDSLYVSCDN
ncbi:unnamed protein product, partial [Meganyctiphanes norvegica]